MRGEADREAVFRKDVVLLGPWFREKKRRQGLPALKDNRSVKG
jgi:hypothetical protein